ncbi:MAG: arginine decarboxylase, pyruvoyl-dependent [Thermaerobacterales bacterium]
MLPTPKTIAIVSGAAEGSHRLTAFDGALLKAGIGNLNLIKVSSILPPHCEFVEQVNIPAGSLTPTAYGAVMSDEPGQQLAAAVAVGFAANDYGTIMEHAGFLSGAEARQQVIDMVEESFAARGLELVEVKVAVSEITVVTCASAVAAAVLWY